MNPYEHAQNLMFRAEEPQTEFMTKNEWVYAKLRADIFCGALTPGERLVVSRIAKAYNVSPMPVRDALNRLAQDGFIEMTPHAGATVITISGKQLQETVVIRMELEPLAASLAVPLLTEETLELLHSMHDRMRQCVDEDDRLTYEAVNWNFHDCIYAHCGNETLYALIMSLWRKSCITRTVFVRLPEKLQHSVSEHQKWLNAMSAREAGAVRDIVRLHVKHTLDRLEQLVEPNFVPLTCETAPHGDEKVTDGGRSLGDPAFGALSRLGACRSVADAKKRCKR